jgi:DNA replication and repair protein RecF
MYLKKLSLVNFKNLEIFDFSPSPKINCFIGDNGIGKTNILDSIHYLSFCKSFINPSDKIHIQYEKDFFIIDGLYYRDDIEEKIYCGVQSGKNKSFRKNGNEYQKLSDHIGFIPLVYSTPTDINLIHGGSDFRRKFVDTIISQFDKNYLNNIIAYNKALDQRNHLLKSFASLNYFDAESIDIWDMQLIEYGVKIHNQRMLFKDEIIDIFQNYYNIIAENREKVDLIYQSQLSSHDFNKLLKDNIKKDRALNYTSSGIHKDDFDFVLNSFALKKYGSQGQQKSYIISLKFAQFDFIKKHTGLAPILLLDDIFDKLDQKRVVQITKLVSDDNFGQIFITDTSYNRMPEILKDLNIKYKILNLSTQETNEN